MSEEPQFVVVVAEVGGRRIDVFKVLGAACTLSLWQASRLLAEVPAVLPGGEQPFEQARRVVGRLRTAGATAGLRCTWCTRAVDPAVPVDSGPCEEQRGLYAACPASY
ncbi:hypothetical protein ACIQF6_28970 [Kitasatospora sp. NPDC092948]|uniref:hypothetical protein n=1 Tax=Kitasatospora sp. NPDC092948 TaxID=3364088 RepID=UPI0037FE5238